MSWYKIEKYIKTGALSHELKAIEAEHDSEIRAEVIDELVVKLETTMPSRLDAKERYGYVVALTIVMEQLKENK